MGISWEGCPSHLLARLVTGFGRIQSAPAKPQKKLRAWSVVSYLNCFILSHAKANKSSLKQMDREIRRFARSALHLPMDTPLGYFLAGVADGSLGIPFLVIRVCSSHEGGSCCPSQGLSESCKGNSGCPNHLYSWHRAERGKDQLVKPSL